MSQSQQVPQELYTAIAQANPSATPEQITQFALQQLQQNPQYAQQFITQPNPAAQSQVVDPSQSNALMAMQPNMMGMGMNPMAGGNPMAAMMAQFMQGPNAAQAMFALQQAAAAAAAAAQGTNPLAAALGLTPSRNPGVLSLTPKTPGSATAKVPAHGVVGQGHSCHQCKSRKNPELLIACTKKHVNKQKGALRACQKKFCYFCISKYYASQSLNLSRPADPTQKIPAVYALSHYPETQTISYFPHQGAYYYDGKLHGARAAGTASHLHVNPIHGVHTPGATTASTIADAHRNIQTSLQVRVWAQPPDWTCPACEKTCSCIKCLRRREKEASGVPSRRGQGGGRPRKHPKVDSDGEEDNRDALPAGYDPSNPMMTAIAFAAASAVAVANQNSEKKRSRKRKDDDDDSRRKHKSKDDDDDASDADTDDEYDEEDLEEQEVSVSSDIRSSKKHKSSHKGDDSADSADSVEPTHESHDVSGDAQ